MDPAVNKIAIISSWNVACGVAEHAWWLKQSLQYLGAEVHIIGAIPAGDHIRTGLDREERVQYLFETGFAKKEGSYLFPATEIFEYLKVNNIKRLILNYQDFLFPNKHAVNELIGNFSKAGGLAYCIIHDTCYGGIEFGAFAGCVLPNKSITPHPPRTRSVHFIEQGIPEFDWSGFDRAAFRKEKLLPYPGGDQDGYLLSTFGLGRTKLADLCRVVEYINESKALPKPLFLNALLPKQSLLEENAPLLQKYPFLRTTVGYLDEFKLGAMLHASEGVLIWYPDITHKATSSAMRFAFGCEVPVIANISAWTNCFRKNGLWLEVETASPERFKHAIISLFDGYEFRRERMALLRKHLLKNQGWTAVGREFMELLRCTIAE